MTDMHPVGSYPLASLLPAIILGGVVIYGFLILSGSAGTRRRLSLPFWALLVVLAALGWLMGGLNPLIPGGNVHIVR
jgi:hypothetical protein